MLSKIAVGSAVAVLALYLHGCSLPVPPRTCFQTVIENGRLPSTLVNAEVEVGVICDEGYEYKGPPLECGWVNRECMGNGTEASSASASASASARRMSDEASRNTLGGANPECQEALNFVAPGTGLKMWPQGMATTTVTEFSNNWAAFMKSQGMKVRRVAGSAAEKAKEAAKSAGDSAKTKFDEAKKKVCA